MQKTGCRNILRKPSVTEQRGKSEGGKEPPSRSIKQFFELFEVQKTGFRAAKNLFAARKRAAAYAAARFRLV